MDNPAPEGTTATQEASQTPQAPESPSTAPSAFSWKSQLKADFANSPTMKKFEDTQDGFNQAVKSHLELEQMLGKEKVVIPKDDKDVEGWNKFAKAMGVPDKAEGYGLEDPNLPEPMKGAYNKEKFAQIAHALKLTPGQAKELQKVYAEEMKTSYEKAVKDQQQKMTQTINQLRSEWGDAYETNVELGQMVINKFSSDQETQDFVTAQIMSRPEGIKFLSKIGEQFAENKIGEFGYKKFSLTPDQAQAEIDQIVRDKNHPYNNDKLPRAERQRAIDYVNNLYATIDKAKRGQA